jgi:preprotein translocase subunit SecE
MSSVEKKKRKMGAEDGSEGTPVATSGAKPASPGIAPKAKAEKTVVETGGGNLFTRAAEFLREVKIELKKVTWPTRKQTTGTTIVVILFVFVVAAFLGLFDFSLSRLVQVVLT